jgi:hypothetical protein
MAFVFDLEDEFPQELPTTLLRSKEDCPKEVSALAGKIDATLLENITKVMNFLRQGSKTHKKLKKKEKPTAEIEEAKEKGMPTALSLLALIPFFPSLSPPPSFLFPFPFFSSEVKPAPSKPVVEEEEE